MNRWFYLLILAAPAAVLAEALHASPLITFVLAALGLIPLAGLIGLSTEVLAERLGHGIGGLLNATFGNAAEIIIGLTALAAGLPEVVRPGPSSAMRCSCWAQRCSWVGGATDGNGLVAAWRASMRPCSPWR